MGKITDFAPVVLFTYNRLEHTRQTVEALQGNMYAEETELFVYADAPKNEYAAEGVEAVRAYLREVTGFKRVKIIERTENWGLARNIMDGVTRLVHAYDRVIVLEDDIVTSKYFLQYMNEALTMYANQSQIMAIAGYCWAKDKKDLPETFFLRWFCCWGWATWREAWDKFERNPEKLIREHNMAKNAYYNMNGKQDMWSQVEQNLTGELYTWAIFFYTAIWLNDGLVLYSNEDLCVNIGFDGSGEHCGGDMDGAYCTKLRQTPVREFSTNLQTDVLAEKRVADFYVHLRKYRPRLYKRVLIVWRREGFRGVVRKIRQKVFR